jgi:F-type H+-transporting ATPase subunit delta
MKISIKQYSQTLLELTDGKSEQEISVIVGKFALQLKNDGQIKNVSKIVQKFSEIYNVKNGIVEATVISARKLENDQIGKIENVIKEKYSAKEVMIENVIDKEIKGGIIVKVGDEVLDGSITSQLKRLKNILSK